MILDMINTNKKKVKDEERMKSDERIEEQNNSKSIITMSESKVTRDWILTDRGLTPGNKIRCTQPMSNSAPTMNNKNRGDPDMVKRRCRWCKDGIEDDA